MPKVYTDRSLLDQHLQKNESGSVVFTNGVFDLLHPGHVDVLQFSKSCGDTLVVGVNTDESVRRLEKKGDRPIFPLAERMEVLAALACVDYVVPFDEDTPLELIETLQKVTVLVKGGDYSPEQMIGREIVEARGGGIQICSFTHGYSSTNIVERLWQSKKD